MIPITMLQPRDGSRVLVAFDHGYIERLARAGEVDAYIVATEDGFSPLGGSRRFLSADLGVPENKIRQLADWNRFENPHASLIALDSQRKTSCLRGIVLAASETSECYKCFATPTYGRPHRDFYYNVTYEAITHAVECWGPRRIALSHLSGCGKFHEDIATCNAEALAHYCDAHPAAIESFVFLGCCISREHLSGIRRLNDEGTTGRHQPIRTRVEKHDGYTLVHLDW